MNHIVETVQDYAEGQIDFEGQRLAELLSTLILVVVGGIAFLAGYVAQDAKVSLFVGLGGTAIAFLVVIPPWPYFNNNPVKWLPKSQAQSGISGIEVDGKKIN